MERAVFDRMAALDGEHWWFTARRRILDAAIRRVVRPPAAARILEIGCGTGHNLAMLSAFGTVEASELDPHARDLARARSGIAVEDAALPGLHPFAADRYDMVALLDVLEHVTDDRAALAAILTRLKPGGALLLTVPGHPWMWSPHDVAHHHHRRYRLRALEHLVRETGFEIQLSTPFNTILFPPIAAARALGRLADGRSRGGDAQESARSDDRMPPAPLNRLLDGLFGLEAALVGRMRLPFGVSYLMVARRPG